MGGALLENTPGGFRANVLLRYVAEAEGHVADLARALEAQNVRQARVLAHSLIGTSRNLGFTGLAQSAEEIEQHVLDQRIGEAVHQLPVLAAEVSRVAAFARSPN